MACAITLRAAGFPQQLLAGEEGFASCGAPRHYKRHSRLRTTSAALQRDSSSRASSRLDRDGRSKKQPVSAEWNSDQFKAEIGKALLEKITALESQDASTKAEQVAALAVEEVMKHGAKPVQSTELSLNRDESIAQAAKEAASSFMQDLRVMADEANEAIAVAKERARAAEQAIAKLGSLQDIVEGPGAGALALEKTISDLQKQLEMAKLDMERLQNEADTSKLRAEAAEDRANKAQARVQELQTQQEAQASESIANDSSSVDSIKSAAAAREAAVKKAFDAQVSSVLAALEASQKSSKLNEEMNSRRLQALELSLAAAEAEMQSWKERALNSEALLQQVDSSADVTTSGGRMQMLLGTESNSAAFFSSGPRRDIPDWMKRRIQAGLQGLAPRQEYVVTEEDDSLPLPSPTEVWSVSEARASPDDLFCKEIAAKEALDKQRRDLEQAFETTTRRRKKLSEEKQESGTGSGREIVLQGFNWESCRKKWYLDLAPKAADISNSGITTVWLPPPTQSVAPQGYMPTDLYNLNSAYGSVEELKYCVQEMHKHDLLVLGDVVLNHRCAQKQNANGVWNLFGGKLAWGPEAIVCDDPNFQGQGSPSSGDIFHAAPNIDHSQEFIRNDIKDYLLWLKTEIGFDGWRLDFVRGFWGGYVKEYVEASEPAFAIGEYWDSLQYEGGNIAYNQDAHRQRIINWINATGGSSSAFDVTTKGILHAALHNEYWRLIDPQQKPPGVLGWWPSRAVTFLENHDTGSTQGHWPFPREKLMQGYAYILTHPGTPVIFYDHFYDFGLHDPIVELITSRNQAGIHCRSPVKILHALKEGYVAKIGENLVVKLGHYDWNPSKENDLIGNWERVVNHGSEYQIWEKLK